MLQCVIGSCNNTSFEVNPKLIPHSASSKLDEINYEADAVFTGLRASQSKPVYHMEVVTLEIVSKLNLTLVS